MAAPLLIWTQPTGYSFGTVNEQVAVNIALPVDTSIANVVYKVISGSLPGGVRIEGNHLVGSPYIISNVIEYKFCIRASKNGAIADRTFTLVVNGATPPVFITPPNDLAIGIHQQLYALAASYVKYQIEAYDINIGNDLTYFIASGDGALPPGLTLSKDGLIEGYIKVLSTSALNTSYQFTVTLTNGISYAQRTFRIEVVGDDQFRADSLVLDGYAGIFTADSTYIRSPVWVSSASLGIVRANNYLTLPVTVYDNTNTVFRLETTNTEVYAIAKRLVPTDNISSSSRLTLTTYGDVPEVGQYFTLLNYVSTASSDTYRIHTVVDLGNNQYILTLTTPLLVDIPDNTYFYIGTLSTLPTGTQFDIASGEVYGRIPYQPAITKTFTFTITAVRYGDDTSDYVTSSRTFTIDVLGEITSAITWNTNPDLGEAAADYISTLRVNATSNVPGASVLYSITSGQLPSGLTLDLDGEIIGTVNQYYNPVSGLLGITSIDNNAFGLDAGTTTVDRIYKFTVTAQDQYNYSANAREFKIKVTTPNTKSYSNIKARPFLAPVQRNVWRGFINNNDIFTTASLYRTNDPSFGVQSDLNMLVYAGIETEIAAAYIGAIGLNHKRKRFTLGSVKKALAIDPVSGETVYEVVYVQVLDPQEPNGKHIATSVTLPNSKLPIITVDQMNSITIDGSGWIVSNPEPNNYFINSITNWQERIAAVGQTERNYLPLWMRTIQPDTKEQLGYILAVPLCFCKAGTADDIILNIKHSSFDFKVLDYTIDRYTIDSVTGQTGDKYLVFKNDRITV